MTTEKSPLYVWIGTKNRFKELEMKWYFDTSPNVHLRFLSEIEVVPEVVEDGKTLLDNAIKKAIALSQLLDIKDQLVFTSDAGGDIPGLGDTWDYRSPKRNMGEHATDQQRARKLFEMMKHLKNEDERAFHYPVALAFARNGEYLWAKEFRSYSAVITSKPDFNDIGKDRATGRMLWLEEFGKTEDQLTEAEHNVLRDRHQLPIKKEIAAFILDL